MKKLSTFLLFLCACTFVMAQSVRPEAVIAKAGDVKPVIDGVVDDLWATVTQHDVILPFKTELPSLGAEGTTYWKALYDDAGLYIIIVANDDVWFPLFDQTGSDYTFDKIELYFDTNPILADAKGGQNGTTGNRQIGPNPTKGKVDGELLTTSVLGGTVQYAYKVADPAWTTEWFVPWESIPDKDGNNFEKSGTMGFDVDITDNDNDGLSRKRAMWSNDGTRGVMDENWGNMDEAGWLTFEGAEAVVPIDAITISGPQVITTPIGTVQLTAAIDPVDATQAYVWKVTGGTGLATIDKNGLVTAKINGTVIIKAYSADLFVESNELTITVSGQVVDKYSDDTWNLNNIITNWNYDTDLTGWGGWVDGGVTGQTAPEIVNGVCVMKVGKASDGAAWHYQHNQSPLAAEADVEYTVRFKSWASANGTPCVLDFESGSAIVPADGGDQYVRYGISTDPGNVGGQSEWNYTVNTVPDWFTFHVTFDRIIPTTIQKIQWMNSLSDQTIYLDSIFLVKSADVVILTSTKSQLANSMRVYPNPVGAGTQLNVVLTSMNSKVAIYNALGQKMMEKLATGNIAKFDVSSLRKGMYFVRLADGTSQKFIR